MCLILIATQYHPDYPLILAANRDEFYHRPTTRVAFWEDHPQLLAGRDEEAGGTWLGITRPGKVGMITNFREPALVDPAAPSRGLLVSDYLTGNLTPEPYIQKNAELMAQCNGFNLIIGDRQQLWYYSNREERHRRLRPLEPGIYGLCNHLLDTPWPKVRRGKAALAAVSGVSGGVSHEELLNVLADRTTPADDQLPDTGVGLDWERRLSPIFVRTSIYGTRSSTVISVDKENMVRVTERSYAPDSDSNGDDGLTCTVTKKAFQIEQ